MPRPQLTLYADVVSPFAYIAWHATKYSPAFKGCDVEVIPIFLGGLMQKCNNRPPMEIKNKGEYTGYERKRYIKMFNVPMSTGTPKPFPQLTLNVMRAMIAVQQKMPEKLDECFEALYRTFWGELRPIGEKEVWTGALKEVLGAEATEKIVALSTTPEVKKGLLDNTEKAFQDGAFGLPYFVATNEKGERQGFWGVSHLGLAVEFMGLDTGVEGGFRAML